MFSHTEDRLLSVKEVADRLTIQEGTVRSWLRERRLPKVNVGRSVRVPARAIEELIANGTTPARRAS